MSERDAGSFGPFFEIAGSGYAIDEPNGEGCGERRAAEVVF